MAKAYVLMVVAPGQTKHILDQLRELPKVTECHEVHGPYDIVAEAEVGDINDIPNIVRRIRPIVGVESTTTLLAIPEWRSERTLSRRGMG